MTKLYQKIENMNPSSRSSVDIIQSILVVRNIPVPDGSLAERRDYFYYCLLSQISDVQVVVLDADASAFRRRARATADVCIIPLRQIESDFDSENGLFLPIDKWEQFLRRLAIQWVGPDGPRVYCVETALADILSQAGLSVSNISILDRALFLSYKENNSVRSLVGQLAGAPAKGERNRFCILLSGDLARDSRRCQWINEQLARLSNLLRQDIRADLFGLNDSVVNSWPYLDSREWSELTGRTALACLCISWLTDPEDQAFLQALCQAQLTTLAVPKIGSLAGEAETAADVISFPDLNSLATSLLVWFAERGAEKASLERARSVSLVEPLRACLERVGAPVQDLSKLPTSIQAFLFDDKAPLRISPFVGDVVIYFVPATGLLNIQALFRHSSECNEIRVLSSDGAELGRVLATKKRRDLPAQPIDGGFVLHDTIKPPSIRIQVFASGRFCWEVAVDQSEIGLVRCEIASLSFCEDEMVHIKGTVWSDESEQSVELRLPPGGMFRLMPTQPHDASRGHINSTRFDVVGDVDMASKTEFQARLMSSEAGLERHIAVGGRFSRQLSRRNSLLTRKRDQHHNRRAWVIGNGPSVRTSDLDKIAEFGDIVFCFNRFYLAYDETKLREDYLISADTLMIEDFGREMVERSSGVAHFCLNDDECPDFQGNFVRVPKMDLALPVFSPDADRFVHVGGSSVFVALQLAYFYGISDVMLYGMDYSFSHTPAFDPKYPMPVSFDEGNHFIKGYRAEKPWCPPNWRDISFGFLKARIAFEADGRRVTNVTRGGKLEIFERASLEEILGSPL